MSRQEKKKRRKHKKHKDKENRQKNFNQQLDSEMRNEESSKDFETSEAHQHSPTLAQKQQEKERKPKNQDVMPPLQIVN